jgi:hypothetical protein
MQSPEEPIQFVLTNFEELSGRRGRHRWNVLVTASRLVICEAGPGATPLSSGYVGRAGRKPGYSVVLPERPSFDIMRHQTHGAECSSRAGLPDPWPSDPRLQSDVHVRA